MSLEFVCTEDLKVKFTNNSGPPDIKNPAAYLGDQGVDPVKIVPTYSQKNKLGNRRVTTTGVNIQWTAATGCAFVSSAFTFVTGLAAIQPGALSTKAEGGLVLRKGDRSLVGCIGSWTNNSSGATVACSCQVEISDAGQDKAKAQ